MRSDISDRRVAIVVDSAASVPAAFRDDPLTFVVPMRLHIGDEEFRDGVDVSPTEFYRLQRGHAGQTRTSAPTPGDFVEAFINASQVADYAVCITVSSTFSSSFQAAMLGRSEVRGAKVDLEIGVVDSRSAAGGQGLVAWEALKASDACASPEAVEAAAEETAERVRLLAFVDTLHYLWRGGRVPVIAHAAVSLLSLKPVFELRHSEVATLARPRTARRAINRLVSLMADRVGDRQVHAIVMHAQAPENAGRLSEILGEEFQCVELFQTEFTPVMGAHIGPGMVGAAFWAESEECRCAVARPAGFEPATPGSEDQCSVP